MIILDENYNHSKEDASSPSKRRKDVVEVTSPSVHLRRLPLSPRKDLNLSSPVHQPQDRSSTPHTLPKASLKPAIQPLTRTRRNLTSSFASLTPDSSSFLQQRCNSVEEIRDKTLARGETKIIYSVSKSATLSAETSTTPSKSRKKVGTPSKAVAERPRLTRTPSKTAETPSKHELTTMRLIKDTGVLLSFCRLWSIFTCNVSHFTRWLLYICSAICAQWQNIIITVASLFCSVWIIIIWCWFIRFIFLDVSWNDLTNNFVISGQFASLFAQFCFLLNTFNISPKCSSFLDQGWVSLVLSTYSDVVWWEQASFSVQCCMC